MPNMDAKDDHSGNSIHPHKLQLCTTTHAETNITIQDWLPNIITRKEGVTDSQGAVEGRNWY